MTTERRASIRRQAALPLAWCRTSETASLAEVCAALGLPTAIALQSRLSELDDDFKRLCAGLPDVRLADVLRVLDNKVSVLEEALLAQAPQPDARAVEISADGIGFDSAEPLAAADWLGVHLVLPVSYHIVCRAWVSHCDPQPGGGYRIGAEFRDMESPAGRRLTRYAIGR
jgi:hypothetical protein